MENHAIKQFVEKMKSRWLRFVVDHVTGVQEYQQEREEGETDVLRETMRGQFKKLKEKGLSIRIITM